MLHFLERVKERYNVEFSLLVAEEIEQVISRKEPTHNVAAQFLYYRGYRDRHSMAVYHVDAYGKLLFVMFDQRNQQLVTALPQNSFEERRAEDDNLLGLRRRWT